VCKSSGLPLAVHLCLYFMQWWAEPSGQQATSGGGGTVSAPDELHSLRQDSWPPPPQPTARAQEAALAAMQHAAQQAAQLAANYGSSLALQVLIHLSRRQAGVCMAVEAWHATDNVHAGGGWASDCLFLGTRIWIRSDGVPPAQGSAGPASDLVHQLEERDALRGGQPSPALLDPAGWAPQPSALNPAHRQNMYAGGGGASTDLRTATTAAWQSSSGMQRDLVRQASDPPTPMVRRAAGTVQLPVSLLPIRTAAQVTGQQDPACGR
jgi:hypothetical protein